MASFLPYPYLRVPHSDNFILQTVPTMSHSYRRFAQWIPWGHGLPFQLNRHATVQFVQRQLFWVCPSRHDSSCSSNYGLHWSKGMGSRWLPSTRVCADGEPKVWHPRYPMPGCGEAKSQSLGEKLWLWCQRWALPGSLSEDLWLVWSPRWCGPLQGVHGLGTVGQWTGCSCGSCQSWRRGQQQSAKLSGPQSSELFRIKSKESCSNHFHHHLFQCRWRPLLS